MLSATRRLQARGPDPWARLARFVQRFVAAGDRSCERLPDELKQDVGLAGDTPSMDRAEAFRRQALSASRLGRLPF